MAPVRYRRHVGESPPSVESFTSSLSDDLQIASYVLKVFKAHVVALASANLLPQRAARRVAAALVEAERELPKVLEKSDALYEDVFEALESLLHDHVGEDAGYVTLGRSRNDHIAAALRLFARSKLLDLIASSIELRKVLIMKAEEFADVYVPSFTHLQVAQAMTAATYFLAFEEALADACHQVFACLELVDKCPLGSGASAGTATPVPKHLLAELLGFKGVIANPYYGTSSRLFAAYSLSAATVVMAEISRLAEDLIILSSTGYGAVELPPAHVSTSSVMPHKRNPVTLEVLRARAAEVLANLTALLAMTKGLPYGYNLDLQEANRHLFRALTVTVESLRVLADAVRGLKLKRERLEELLKASVFWSGELAERIATSRGAPFRSVYFELAEAFRRDGWRVGESVRRLLREAGWPDEVSPEFVTGLRVAEGGVPSPTQLVESARSRLAADEKALAEMRSKIASSAARLQQEFSRLLEGGSDA